MGSQNSVPSERKRLERLPSRTKHIGSTGRVTSRFLERENGTGSLPETTAGSVMDLVSFETEEEWNLVKNFMDGAGIKEIWTSGRLCDAEVSGCEADHYKPLNINGWFWASTLVKMLPTNRPIGLNPDGVRVIGVNEWAKTGDKGKPQPDGFTPEGGLGEEPCMAVIDGKWHDTSCHNRRAIVCEDLPDQNIQFVRNENPNIRIP